MLPVCLCGFIQWLYHLFGSTRVILDTLPTTTPGLVPVYLQLEISTYMPWERVDTKFS